MKLSPIRKKHILSAATIMDRIGDNSWAEYWVQLDNGKEYQFKHLTRKAYEIATGEKLSNDFFQSNDSYRSYIERTFGYRVIFRIPDNISFFSGDDIEFFSIYASKPYRSGNQEHKTAGKRISDGIFRKSNVWGRLLNLDEWEIVLDNRWQLSGNFKPYSWIRIYKRQDRNIKVFFTLGVDGIRKTLVYKLDCQRKHYTKENALSTKQVEAFDRIRNGTGAERNEISIEELSNYNWEKLRKISIEFINKYEFLYRETIEAVHSAAISNQPISEESLENFPIPSKAFDRLPVKEYNFNGVVIDYDAENKNAKKIGDGGEELVLKMEKKFLKDKGLNDLIDKVKKVKDGEGYDVLSFDINRNEKFIEVKTTTGINTRPFRMTDNEWEFMRQNSESYYLYRIYEYDKETKRGKFFCISGSFENMVFTKPKQFDVFLKTKKTIEQ